MGKLAQKKFYTKFGIFNYLYHIWYMLNTSTELNSNTMNQSEEITRDEFEAMIAKYGHHMDVKVPVRGQYGETEMRCVLNNAMVYNPYGKRVTQVGMSSNDNNAQSAMKFIKDTAVVYSSVFHFTTGQYSIVG